MFSYWFRPIFTDLYGFPEVQSAKNLIKNGLKGIKGEFFPFFCQTTPRPPYVAIRPCLPIFAEYAGAFFADLVPPFSAHGMRPPFERTVMT